MVLTSFDELILSTYFWFTMLSFIPLGSAIATCQPHKRPHQWPRGVFFLWSQLTQVCLCSSKIILGPVLLRPFALKHSWQVLWSISKLVLTLDLTMPIGDFVNTEMSFMLIHAQVQKSPRVKLYLFHIGIWNVGTVAWQRTGESDLS